jgi:hypothetical protein
MCFILLFLHNDKYFGGSQSGKILFTGQPQTRVWETLLYITNKFIIFILCSIKLLKDYIHYYYTTKIQ